MARAYLGRRRRTGQGYGRTGRGALSYQSRRKRVISATYPSSTIPRTLYPFVPGEMRIALRCNYTNQGAVPAGATYIAEVPVAVPQLVAGAWPEYLEQFMGIYSRARVDKVHVTLKVMNTTVNPLQWAFGIGSASDGGYLGGGDAFQRVRMLPSAKFGFIGSTEGGHDQATASVWYDLRKAIGPGIYSQQYATTSNAQTPPVITIPVVANAPDMPWGYAAFLGGAANTEVILSREVVYHMTFSGIHAQAL